MKVWEAWREGKLVEVARAADMAAVAKYAPPSDVALPLRSLSGL